MRYIALTSSDLLSPTCKFIRRPSLYIRRKYLLIYPATRRLSGPFLYVLNKIRVIFLLLAASASHFLRRHHDNSASLYRWTGLSTIHRAECGF